MKNYAHVTIALWSVTDGMRNSAVSCVNGSAEATATTAIRGIFKRGINDDRTETMSVLWWQGNN